MNYSSCVEKARRLDQQRQVMAANTDCQRLRHKLFEAFGIGQDELERCQEHEATEMRAFLERGAVNHRSNWCGRTAARTTCSPASCEAFRIWSTRNDFQKPIVHYVGCRIMLDVASIINTNSYTPVTDSVNEAYIKSDQPSSMHNFVKGYLITTNKLFSLYSQYFSASFFFPFPLTSKTDLLLDASTVLQPNGMYTIALSFTPLAQTRASFVLSAGLQFGVIVPPPPPANTKVYLASPTSQAQYIISHEARVGPFDFFGAFDFGDINNEITLSYSGLRLPAGLSCVFIVSVYGLVLTNSDNGSVLLDFEVATLESTFQPST